MIPDWSVDRQELLGIASAADGVAAAMPVDGRQARTAATTASINHREFASGQAATAAMAAWSAR